MDDIEMLKKMQSGFPLTRHPLRTLSKRFKLCEEDLLGKMRNWKSRGLIRNLGAILDLEQLGYTSTLIAMQVRKNNLERVVTCINRYPQVSHNYLREGSRYNLWFTLSASSSEALKGLIRKIRKETRIRKFLELPKTSSFKRRAVFS